MIVPKISISPDVHTYFLKRCGDNYQNKAKEVATLWDDEVRNTSHRIIAIASPSVL